jgi:hypothetical protein
MYRAFEEPDEQRRVWLANDPLEIGGSRSRWW